MWTQSLKRPKIPQEIPTKRNRADKPNFGYCKGPTINKSTSLMAEYLSLGKQKSFCLPRLNNFVLLVLLKDRLLWEIIEFHYMDFGFWPSFDTVFEHNLIKNLLVDNLIYFDSSTFSSPSSVLCWFFIIFFNMTTPLGECPKCLKIVKAGVFFLESV